MNQISHKETNMRNNNKAFMVGFILLVLFAAGMYYIIFGVIVPKTAILTTPQKWGMLPLNQTKDIVRGYLGEPVLSQPGIDKWTGGSKGKLYELRIYYVSDTIAMSYSIHYQYASLLVSRDYLIDSASIR